MTLSPAPGGPPSSALAPASQVPCFDAALFEKAWAQELPGGQRWDTLLSAQQGSAQADMWLRLLLEQALGNEETGGVQSVKGATKSAEPTAAQKAQTLWRQWRALHMYAQSLSGAAGVLLAIPAWGASCHANDHVAYELQAGLRHWAHGRQVQLTVLAPCTAAQWHRTSPEALLSLVQAAQNRAAPTTRLPSLPEFCGPWVWPVWAQAPLDEEHRLAPFFTAPGPKDPDLVRLLMRVESLLEQGSSALLPAVRLLPPTAGWNADSLARLSWARALLLHLGADGWMRLERGTRWILGLSEPGNESPTTQPAQRAPQTAKQEIAFIDFAAETLEDISRVQRSAAQAQALLAKSGGVDGIVANAAP